MPPIYLTPTLSCMFIINGSYTKSKRLLSLDSLLEDVVTYCCVSFGYTGSFVNETL